MEPVSYAEVLRETVATMPAFEQACDEPTCACTARRNRAAALRALAEEISVPDEPWILEINGESFATDTGIRLLTALATGFHPRNAE